MNGPTNARPWTHEELAELRRQIEEDLAETERQNPGIRPLPPMSENEARDTLLALLQVSEFRRLSPVESFTAEELLAAYRMAVEARMLGKTRGRYYVINEADIERLMKEKRP